MNIPVATPLVMCRCLHCINHPIDVWYIQVTTETEECDEKCIAYDPSQEPIFPSELQVRLVDSLVRSSSLSENLCSYTNLSDSQNIDIFSLCNPQIMITVTWRSTVCDLIVPSYVHCGNPQLMSRHTVGSLIHFYNFASCLMTLTLGPSCFARSASHGTGRLPYLSCCSWRATSLTQSSSTATQKSVRQIPSV